MTAACLTVHSFDERLEAATSRVQALEEKVGPTPSTVCSFERFTPDNQVSSWKQRHLWRTLGCAINESINERLEAATRRMQVLTEGDVGPEEFIEIPPLTQHTVSRK